MTREHNEIIAALREHNPDKVEAMVTRHLINAEERTKKALSEISGGAGKNDGK